MQAFQKSLSALQAQIVANANSSSNTQTYQNQIDGMNDYRNGLVGTMAAMQQYRVRQGQVLSAQDAYQKKIADGKATFGDLIKNHKMLGGILRDQIALQRSLGVGWSQSTKTGKFSVDQFIPTNLPANLKTLKSQIGLMSNVLAVASDNMVKWGKNTQWAGRQLMVGFTVPMGIAAAATGKMAYDLDKALTQVVKVYGDATASMQESANGVRETALTTARAAARIYGQSANDTLKIMADLAASGKSGMELQQATMATTRAAILGELDWQDAVKATISMQEVYGASQQELADNWNYINAMENQTVLSAQDFVTAIPKVSGVMNALGADLKDTGALLTAFKAAGIDAAEGANALKSINFRLVATYGKGLETFSKKTGQDLRAIIAETNGDTIPSLEKFAAAIKDLSAPDRIAVTRDVFGIYQGSKALMLLEQMTQKTEALTQWTQALNVANNTALENAAIAQQELDRQNDQPFKKLDKAVETLKINLASIGEAFLEPAASILSVVGDLAAGFNNMSAGTKFFLGLAAAVVGLAGPVIMLVGLFANLLANGMKMFSTLGMLTTGFKMMTVEERMQQIVSSKMVGTWDAQTASAAALTTQIQHLVAALNAVNPAAAAAQRAPLPAGMAYNKAGHPMYTDSETHATSVKGRRVKGSDLNAILEQEQLQVAADKTAAKMTKLAHATTTAATAAGLLGNMLGMTEGVGGIITELLTGLGIFGMMAPGLMTKAFTKIGAGASKMGTKIKGALNLGENAGKSFIGAISKAGPIIAGVALAGYAAWSYFDGKVQESVERMKNFNNYAQSMSDILGYSYVNGGPISPNNVTDGKTAADLLAVKLRETNADAADVFSSKNGADIGEKWGAALAAGVDAKLHGATVQQAKDTARVAMALMGERFDDAQFDIAIDAHVNFDDMDSMVKIKAEQYRRMMQEALNPDISWNEGLFNFNELDQKSAENAKKAGSDFWNLFFSTPEKDRKKLLDTFSQSTDKFLNDAYARQAKAQPELMKKYGINNAYDFGKQVLAAGGDRIKAANGMTDDEYAALRKQLEFVQVMTQEVGRLGGVSKENLPTLIKLSDLFREGAITEDFGQVDTTGIFNATEGLGGLYSGLVGVAKQTGKAAAALDYFSNVAGGAAVDSEQFNQALQDLGYNAAITFDELKTSWNNIYSGASSAMFDDAARVYEERTQNVMDAQKKSGEKLIDDIDKRADKLSKKYDKKSRDLDAKQKAEDRAFEKRWDDRKKREEAAYDARIDAVDKAIEAEQKAEEIRQKIFEAEKTRISRLAEMYSRNIDINMAINSGNLDEAAKLTSNGTAQELQWALDDQAATTGDASKKRIDDLNTQKDTIEKSKKARMDALDEIEQREKDAHDARQQRAKDELKAAEDTAKKKLDAEKKAQQELNADNERKLAKRLADRKREMDDELAALRAFVPRNKGELQWQMTEISKVYDKYGKDLDGKGLAWSKSVGGYLSTQVAIEGNRLKSVVNWAGVGQDIAASMMKGAFGMTPQQFAAFINGGEAPKDSLFGSGAAKFVQRKKTSPYGGRLNDPNDRAWHTGGVVSRGGSPGRVGRSGGMTAGEIDARLLVGEGIVSRQGMSKLGKAGLDYINGGGRGGGGGGFASMMGATTGAALGQQMIVSTLRGAYMKRTGSAGKNFGKNFGVETSAASLIGDIFNSGVSVAYKSGKVVYLGHGSYPGGGDFSGNVRPTTGTVTSLFGPRNLLGMSFHNGLDIANAAGTPIKAARGGRVIYTGWDNTGYGNYTQIQSPDGTMYGYGHQSSIGVRAGMKVNTGQLIGRMGSTGKSTGPHLHFQTGRNGIWFNPRTVMPQLEKGGFTLNEGVANLHPNETVMTAPLTEKFKRGVDNFANNGGNEYNVHMHLEGATITKDVDIEGQVYKAIQKIEKKNGSTRRVN